MLNNKRFVIHACLHCRDFIHTIHRVLSVQVDMFDRGIFELPSHVHRHTPRGASPLADYSYHPG